MSLNSFSQLSLCTFSIVCIIGLSASNLAVKPYQTEIYIRKYVKEQPYDRDPMKRKMAPFIAGKAEEWVLKDEESNFGMECRAYGYPPPVVNWFKNGYHLSSNYRRYIRDGNQVMDIRDADPMDTGRYKCLAVNPYGMARKEFRVLIMASSPHVG